MGTPVYQFDSSTRAGKGPQWNYVGVGPFLVSRSQGTAPNWASSVYLSNLGGQAQEIRFRLHNLDDTPPVVGAAQVFVKIYIAQPGDTSIPAWQEVYNVGLVSTETWEAPISFPLNPGCQLLAVNTDVTPGSSGVSIYLDIHTLV